MVYYIENIPINVGLSITSITQLWKPWSHLLTATSRVTPKLSSKGITPHEISRGSSNQEQRCLKNIP